MAFATISTKSPLPFPEPAALEQAPVKWDLGSGAQRISMRAPLFSLHRYGIFESACRAVKFALGAIPDAEIGLDRIVVLMEEDGLKKNPDKRSGMAEFLRESIENFKREWGVIPQSLAEILIAVSDPADLKQATKVLSAWCKAKGMPWDIPSEPEKHPEQIRDLLVQYVCHACDIAELVLTLEYLQKINTYVKKKLRLDLEQGESALTKASRRSVQRSSDLTQKQQSSKSPS
jgi:hypothetical protein